MVLLGLAQRFLESNLHYNAEGPGVGTVLEVKEERGLGTTLDLILYDGVLKKGDTIVVGCLGEPIQTKVRAVLKPRALSEINVEDKFKQVSKVTAAVGVKISAPHLDGALSGGSVRVATAETLDAVVEEVRNEVEDVQIDTDQSGITIKADTIGSLEALVNELKKEDIPIRKADVGDISNRDIMEAFAIEDPFHSVIVGFNVNILPDAKEKVQSTGVKVFMNDVIYRLIDDYRDWVKEQRAISEKAVSETIVKPAMFTIMPDCVFRQSKPAVVGVRVIGGTIKTKVDVTTGDGTVVGIVKGLQSRGENVSVATIGMEVAMSIEGPTVGRQINEGDILHANIPERHAKILEHELYDSLSADELEALDSFLDIKRRDNPFWAK